MTKTPTPGPTPPWADLIAEVTTAAAAVAAAPDEYGIRSVLETHKVVEIRRTLDAILDDALIRSHDQGVSYPAMGYGRRQSAHVRHQAAVARREAAGGPQAD